MTVPEEMMEPRDTNVASTKLPVAWLGLSSCLLLFCSYACLYGSSQFGRDEYEEYKVIKEKEEKGLWRQ